MQLQGKVSQSLSIVITIAVIGMVVMMGPANAVVVKLTVDKPEGYTSSDLSVTFDVAIDIENGERIPVNNLTLDITGPSSQIFACTFWPKGTAISGCDGMTITLKSSPMYGYGYGYGYGYSYGYGYAGTNFGNGYGYGYGYGYNAWGKYELEYNVIWDITSAKNGSYSATFSAVAQGNGKNAVYTMASPVKFNIKDTKLPTVDYMKVYPEKVSPGNDVNFIAKATDVNGIQSVVVLVGNTTNTSIYTGPLSAGTNDRFTGSTSTTGWADGTYYVSFFTTDGVGNQNGSLKYASFDVASTGGSSGSDGSSVDISPGTETSITLTPGSNAVDLGITGSSSVSGGSITVEKYDTAQNTTSVGIPALGVFIKIDASSDVEAAMDYAMIKVHYTDAEVAAAGIDESTLRLYYYNTGTSTWEKYDGNDGIAPDGGVDTTANYVWANTTHFSTWGLFGSASAAPAPAVTTVGGGCLYKWTCGDWNACQPDGTQTRTCTLKNTCGPAYSQGTAPATTQSCTYTAPVTLTPTPPTTSNETVPAGTTAGPPSGITGMITAGETATYAGIVVVVIIILGAVYFKVIKKKK